MKPAAFTYHAPREAAEVDALLAELGPDAKVLAGGQSLVPILNMRLASPAHLIDLNRVAAGPAAPVLEDDAVEVGALVRQAAAERWDEGRARLPVLRTALRFVAHPAIRSRGTVVGSVAHADPGAELPALLTALGGSAVARGREGSRRIEAADLFAGPFETTLAPGEWMESVRLPCPPGRGYAMEEVARRHGDYALCGVIAVAEGGAGATTRVGLTYFGVGDVPVRVEVPGDVLADADQLPDLVRRAVAAAVEPRDDLHASGALRLRLAERLGARAARRAAAEVAA